MMGGHWSGREGLEARREWRSRSERDRAPDPHRNGDRRSAAGLAGSGARTCLGARRTPGHAVVWRRLIAAPADAPALDGHTDTVPDIVGWLGAPIGLAIFTEGDHFPALLGGEIIEPFRAWARAQAAHAGLALDNIVVVTLPQPMIVRMLLGGGLSLGNLTIEVSRASGFYPDIVMGGAAPLTQLRRRGWSKPRRPFLPETEGSPCWSQPATRSAFKASMMWRAAPSAL
jgi:hypothetical protein